MQRIGLTGDNRIIVQGVGKLNFEQGTPLSIIFDKLNENNFIPSWNHLYQEMKHNGMTHKRIIHLLHEQIFECYGKEFRDVVIDRLEIKNRTVAKRPSGSKFNQSP
jgi:hypothetical protein